MPDFSQLLRKPAGEAKKPQALPAGDYPGRIKGHEYGDSNKNKTPYVRFNLMLTGWADTVDDSERTDAEGKTLDISKRSLRRDFFLTDDALWRLDEFLASLGIDLTGRSYEESIPEADGQEVLVEVQQYMNQQNNEIGNQVGALRANQ